MKALLFDMDGTVADTEDLHMQALRHVAGLHGVNLAPDHLEAISGRTSLAVMADLFPDRGNADLRQLVKAKEQRFRDLSEGLTPMPGLVSLLNRARADGLSIGLVTNAPLVNITHLLRILRIGDYFDTIVTADYVARPKPDPLPYVTALVALKVAPAEALAFEDSAPGVVSATGAGIATVGVATSLDKVALMKAGASAVIADFTEFADYALSA